MLKSLIKRSEMDIRLDYGEFVPKLKLLRRNYFLEFYEKGTSGTLIYSDPRSFRNSNLMPNCSSMLPKISILYRPKIFALLGTHNYYNDMKCMVEKINYLLAILHRSWKTDLSKGGCMVVETSVEHSDAELIPGGVRGIVLASRYLIEPCGSGKSRILHLSRVDIK